MTNLTAIKRIIFFDLDGTIHQQDMFGSFLRYLLAHLPLNILVLIPVLPIVLIGLLVNGRFARWPISLLLWSITFGHSEYRLQTLETRFADMFRRRVRRFPKVLSHLNNYLESIDAQVWIITGSPKSLVEKVYSEEIFMQHVQLIGSNFRRKYSGWILTLRCLGYEKVVQLEHKLGSPLKLYSGYSDSVNDNPLLYFCKYRWRVTSDGQVKQI